MKGEQLLDEVSSSNVVSSNANNNKDLVTISVEEYEKLISDSKRLPDMISREDFERSVTCYRGDIV
ncbi:hypothetical protein [Borrelia turicatae]|nr:hypothetical protein [Borrelia turicatae]UPA14096.1 hypothetical protein bt91E135_001260 [Borrelia turicatae 91E135]